MSSTYRSEYRASDSRDRDDFGELSGRYQLQLLGYIYAALRNMDDAEDVYQQTCVIMWRKFGEFQTDSDFLKWACTIARYEVLNFIRSSKNRPRYFSDDYLQQVAEVPSEQNSNRVEARQQALDGCLQRLKKRDHDLVVRCYCGTDKIQNVAKELGRTPESVYVSLGRIRRALYECINRRLGVEGAHE